MLRPTAESLLKPGQQYPLGASVRVEKFVRDGGMWLNVVGSGYDGRVVEADRANFTRDQLSGMGCLAVEGSGDAAPADGGPRVVPHMDIQPSGELRPDEIGLEFIEAVVIRIEH